MSQTIHYKYRSLENWKYLIDILVRQRLYAASFRSLNDPMEGRYHYKGDDVSAAFDRAIRQSKDYWRICSLTRKPTSTLMWSYYAGGHTGVALGVTVRKRPGQRMERVRYDSDVYVDPRHSGKGARDVALNILSQKQQAWSHEEEVRIFSGAAFVPVRVHSVLLGCQTSPDDEEIIRGLVRTVNRAITVRRMTIPELDAPLDLVGHDSRQRRRNQSTLRRNA